MKLFHTGNKSLNTGHIFKIRSLFTLALKYKTTLSQITNKNKIYILPLDNTGNNITQLPFNLKEIESKLSNLLISHPYALTYTNDTNEKDTTLKVYLDYQKEKNNLLTDELYDIRVLIGADEKEDTIAERILEQLNRDQEYVSTRGSEDKHLFFDVINEGLASDKGLFVPKYFPSFTPSQLQRLISNSYQERCLRILEAFPIGGLNPGQLNDMINAAYSSCTANHNESVLPVRKISDRQFIMEEFYGPSASFKDLALQLFPRIFKESIKNNKLTDQKIAILVATSGDTGSAVLEGFRDESIGVPVIVLYPEGRVSQVQEAQMVTAEGNVNVIRVKADFDFCQSAVKEIFHDSDFKTKLKKEFSLSLSSANSINWGRLLPQVCYTIHSYLELVREKHIEFGTPVDVCIPSGNFGNILGAFIAKRMGLPIDKLICASNESGEFDLRNRLLTPTISPAIDILIPSNIERLLYFLTNDSEKIKSYFEELRVNKYFKIDHGLKYALATDFIADYCTQEEQVETIREVFASTGYILDPHTAVAKRIADKVGRKRSNPVLIASTAHYAKFPETVMKALDMPQSKDLKSTIESLKRVQTVSVFHKNLENIMNKKVIHNKVLNADIGEIKTCIYNIFKEKTLI